MLRLAFDFIITWRETRTRPNAYMKYVGVSSEQMIQALCSMEDNLTLGVEKKYKKIRNKDSLATVLGLR